MPTYKTEVLQKNGKICLPFYFQMVQTMYVATWAELKSLVRTLLATRYLLQLLMVNMFMYAKSSILSFDTAGDFINQF